MSKNLTHWRKLHNPDYLGAYSLEPGKDMVVTIVKTGNEMVVGADGKKEECMVMHLAGQKPMIVNSTNAKTITKVLGSPYIEDWKGGRIQLYATKVKAFGEVVEALRVRDFAPKPEKTEGTIKCEGCQSNIKAYGKMSASELAAYTKKGYGKSLCSVCAAKAAESAKAEAEQIESTETEETDNEQA